MKSVRALGHISPSLPLSADDILELHATRLLLLFHHCGSDETIEGLTKLAKLDFFVRYPSFFERAASYLGKAITTANKQIESPMIRHHYGPWDKRYYQVIAFLESRGLITVKKIGNKYNFILSALGQEKAKTLSKSKPFNSLVAQMKAVRKLLGRKNGNQLKNIVYELFDEEVKQRKFGELIK
jgi:hypothetical protein